MILHHDFFRVKHSSITPETGKILIAEPGLMDQYFKRAVILLVEHNQQGSVGFVLNRPVELSLSDLLPGFPDVPASISIGGPVSPNSIHFIHTLGHTILNSVEVSDGLYWGTDFDALKSVYNTGRISPLQIRFFVGYSGWEEGQLKRELDEHSWVVSAMDLLQIMDGKDKLWNQIVSAMGDRFKPWTIYPENPSLN
jgi:putative transcriptional regulator